MRSDAYQSPYIFGDEDEDFYKSPEKTRRLALKKQDGATSGPQKVVSLALANDNQSEETYNSSGEQQENKVVFTGMEEFVWGLHLNEGKTTMHRSGFVIEDLQGGLTLMLDDRKVYASTVRDSLLAAIRDVLQTEGQYPVPVLPRLTMPVHRIDPPCGIVHLQFPVGRQSSSADMEGATMHLKHLAAAAKDDVAEGGSIPGSRAKLWRRIREFNACISYSGVPPTIEVPEVTLMALITMLPATQYLPPDSPPPPSLKAAATVLRFIAYLRRLLASRSAASHVMSFPAAVGRIMGLPRNGSEGIATKAAGFIVVLVGGGPSDTNLLMDSEGESPATIMHSKSVLFPDQNYVIILVNGLKHISVSPLLSMSIVEILEVMLCEPHGEYLC